MRYNFFSTGLRWLWLSVLVLITDHITKVLAQKYLTLYAVMPVLPGLNFTLTYNRGSAFAFLDSASGWQVWMFGAIAIIVSIAILIWMFRLPAAQKWVGIALAFVVGGALGNLWDRFSYGHVIDFIQVYVSHYSWPVFNVADSAICIGAFMLFLDALKKKG